MVDEENSAIAALLSERGCDCDCHPDELPDGVEPCLPCRAEAEWRALLAELEAVKGGKIKSEGAGGT